MKTITVRVREDHLETLARTKPMTALAELIWNALDAEATEVRVEFVENALEGVDAIRIIDNGHGLEHAEAMLVFGNLGGSWKRDDGQSRARRRVLHGKYGKGRFRAFSLGNRVRWDSVHEGAEGARRFHIEGNAASLGAFQISDPAPAADAAPGMRVEIHDTPTAVELLRGVKARQEVTDLFALYLRHYPDTRIVYDGAPIDPEHAEAAYAEYPLEQLVTQHGDRVDAVLSVVEWSMPGKRGVYFCDEHGFMRYNALPRLHFRGFSYTAYLKSAHVARLDREGLLQADELSPDVRLMSDAARACLREHFAVREAERGQDLIARWRDLDLYPYQGEAATAAEANERRIFDIYATHLHQISPDFAAAPPQNKRLTLRLIQELVRAEPTRVARILDELLEFPEEKEEAILELTP